MFYSNLSKYNGCLSGSLTCNQIPLGLAGTTLGETKLTCVYFELIKIRLGLCEIDLDLITYQSESNPEFTKIRSDQTRTKYDWDQITLGHLGTNPRNRVLMSFIMIKSNYSGTKLDKVKYGQDYLT